MRALIGIFNYYRVVWARLSHLLHPITALTSNKAKFEWTDMEQKTFDDIKSAVLETPY